jgi:hypothetical protein
MISEVTEEQGWGEEDKGENAQVQLEGIGGHVRMEGYMTAHASFNPVHKRSFSYALFKYTPSLLVKKSCPEQ